MSAMKKCSEDAFKNTPLSTPDAATWTTGVDTTLETSAVSFAEGYRCGSYSYEIVGADAASIAATEEWTVAVSESDSAVLEIKGNAAEAGVFTYKLVATADDTDLMDKEFRKFESDGVYVTVEAEDVMTMPLPDNSDTRVLMVIIFGSFTFILILTCFIACCLGKCGKCQGKSDTTPIYNNTEKK